MFLSYLYMGIEWGRRGLPNLWKLELSQNSDKKRNCMKQNRKGSFWHL